MTTSTGTARANNRASEFELSDSDLSAICDLIYRKTGIAMSNGKRDLIYRRLATRLRATGTTSFSDYIQMVQNGNPSEMEAFSNAVTTNLTSFFREAHHFEYLAETILPGLVKEKQNNKRRLRIWSAGCSSGEEPYSIAITLREAISDIETWDAKVLCTDLDSDVLDTAKQGVYASDRTEKVAPAKLKRWFQRGRGAKAESYRANELLRNLLVFKQLNLMDDWPLKGPFDVIFCRNVIIYFDKPTQRRLIARFNEVMNDGAYLILGHSESLFKVSDKFQLIGKTIYRK